MKRNSGAWLLSATVAGMLFVQTACTSPNDAGIDVLPHDETISGHYVDTFSIYMNTLLVDSAQTYRLSRCLFGNYVDEQFGHLFAETYIQPRVQGSNLTFGEDPDKLTLDSLVLTLDLTGFYGRYDDPLPLHIYEITAPFDTTLYSRSSLTADLSYDLARGYKVDFSGQSGFFDFINIRLDDSLGRKLLYAPTSDLASNEFFTNFFKGLLIRTESADLGTSREPGGIFSFDPRGEKSLLKLYYKDSTSSKTYTFPINNNSLRFHKIDRTDWAATLLEQSILPVEDGLVPYGCLEAGALVNMYVGIPSVIDLDPAIINRATLVLSVDPAFLGSNDRFVPPTEINLFVADSTHKKPRDIGIRNSFGSYSKATREYRIPMTNTVQQILSGALPNYGFVLVPSENGVSMNRVVIGGPGHPTLAPRLEVIYTSLPNP